jgi:hypothetical protein
MPEDEKNHEEHKEEKNIEHSIEEKHKLSLPKMRLGRVDIISIVILIIFLILVFIPSYVSKGDCEVARPAYKCASLKNVMIENCIYWGKYNCNTTADVSLPQIEWYIGNLCELQNKYHNSGLDCSNLKQTCNQIVENKTCPVGI